jgi:hypothetical protein
MNRPVKHPVSLLIDFKVSIICCTKAAMTIILVAMFFDRGLGFFCYNWDRVRDLQSLSEYLQTKAHATFRLRRLLPRLPSLVHIQLTEKLQPRIKMVAVLYVLQGQPLYYGRQTEHPL